MDFIRSVLLIGCVTMLLNFSTNGDVKTPSTDTELYSAGLEVISVMDEMLQSEDYAELFGVGNALDNTIERVNTGDYGSPTAVYGISLAKPSELMEIAKEYDSGFAGLWSKLSDNLKRQVENRVSFSTVITLVNGRYGSDALAFSSTFTAFIKNETLYVTEPVTFIYLFRDGTPIAVTFTEHGGIQGQFIFLEDIDTLLEYSDFLGDFGCEFWEVII